MENVVWQVEAQQVKTYHLVFLVIFFAGEKFKMVLKLDPKNIH